MAKYSFTSPKTLSAEMLIVSLSIIIGIAVLGISSLLLHEITYKFDGAEKNPSNSNSGSISNGDSVMILCIGIISVILQLIASSTFWFTHTYQKKDSKSLIYGFACGQSIIQTVLLICLGFVTYEYFKFNHEKHPPGNDPSPSHSIGHGFWIILSANVIFHVVAILYLLYHVMKSAGDEEMEEMTAVVVHRRVPSRIPSQKSKIKKASKRHGGFQMQN